MRSKRTHRERFCENPDCDTPFIPHDRRQLYCTEQCRINYHNDKRYMDNEERYRREEPLRKTDRDLETLMGSKFYKEERIKEEVLEDLELNLTIGTLEKNILTGNPIRWYHSYGIELVDKENRLYTIHYRH
jgi:hypothetical protein